MTVKHPGKIILSLSLALCAFVTEAAPQAVPDQRIEQLGPSGQVYIPETLDEVVQRFAAAVVVDVVGFGQVEFNEARSQKGVLIGTDAYARYHVRIKEVLYNKLGDKAPPLVAGSRVDLTQAVGRDQARAFVARRLPIKEGDECLLFLWHRPVAREWSMVSWPFHFRRSGSARQDAEVTSTLGGLPWLTGRLATTRTDDGISVGWDALVGDIKQVAASQTK